MQQQDDVRRFHEKFGHAAPDRPSAPSPALVAERRERLREETEELVMALESGDLPSILGEVVDVVYVALGTAVACGLRIDRAWEKVHFANLSKYPNPAGGKPLKPEGWVRPDLARLVEEQL